jgi:hypothetical protein
MSSSDRGDIFVAALPHPNVQAKEQSVTAEWTCPVCGTSIVARIYRCSRQGKVTLPPHEDMKVLAYRCGNGHICMASDKTRAGDTASESAA